MTPRKHLLFAAVSLVALVSVTSLAMSSSEIANTENEKFVGTRDPGATITASKTRRSAAGTPVAWGVFGYQSDRGLTCVQAGPIRDGGAGLYSEEGFKRFASRDGVGNCGDLRETFADMGGAVFASAAPVSDDASDQAGVVYGLLDQKVSKVTVTIDKTSERLPVELSGASGMGGAARSFVAPLPPEASLPGVTVTFELEDGTQTVSKI